MIRRPLAALATALSAAALVAVPTAGPANAAGTCTLTPPARIAIYQTDVALNTTITGDCQPAGYGYWYGPGLQEEPRPNYATAVFDASVDAGSYIFVPDRLATYGRQQWEAYGAVRDATCEEDLGQSTRQADKVALRSKSARVASSTARAQAACEELSQNEPFTDIRLGSYASLTGVRSGSRITFTAGSGGWSPASHKAIPRPYLYGEIQTQYADGSWHRVGNPFRTGANAKATVTVTIPAARSFRYAVYSTAYYFERATTPITR